MSARVYAHEAGGDSDVVTLDTVIGRIVAEAPAPLLLVEGDELQIGLDPEHFYYVCKEAGHNLLLETS